MHAPQTASLAAKDALDELVIIRRQVGRDEAAARLKRLSTALSSRSSSLLDDATGGAEAVQAQAIRAIASLAEAYERRGGVSDRAWADVVNAVYTWAHTPTN